MIQGPTVNQHQHIIYISGHQRVAPGHQITHKDQGARPQACSEYSIIMLNFFTSISITK